MTKGATPRHIATSVLRDWSNSNNIVMPPEAAADLVVRIEREISKFSGVHTITLSEAAWDRFCHALDNPKPPTEALRQMLRGDGETQNRSET